MECSGDAISLTQPKDEWIQTVIASKKRIADLTGKVLDTLYDSESGIMPRAMKELFIKKNVNEIVSELSTIAGFCGSRERDFVSKMAGQISEIIIYSESTIKLLEDWCMMVNGIAVDFDRTPFSFLNTEFRTKWQRLQNKIDSLTGKR